jgi:hypothetical protein
MQLDLKFKTRVVQNNNQGHYAIYIFENILEDDYLKEILNKTLELTEKDSMNHQTNVKANMTTFTKMLEDPLYTKLQRIILSFLHTSLCLRTEHPIVPAYSFLDFWGMKFKKGENTIRHTHLGDSTWSGIFCIDSDDQTGHVVFPDMDFQDVMKSNSLYIFPSMMPHLTVPHLSDKPRVGLSFNLQCVKHW